MPNPECCRGIRPGILRSAWICALAAVCLMVGGCHLPQWMRNGYKVGPEYCHPPAATVAPNWIDSNDPQVISRPPKHPDWWAVFQDPVLDKLIQEAYAQNLSLRVAGWRVMQARAQRAIVAGNLFPQTQQGYGEFSRMLESENIAIPSPLRAFDQWSTGFNLSWELDVWGRFRRSIASADANVQVLVGDYDAILLSLIAEVAIVYSDYRTFQQRLVYARHNIAIQEGSLKLTQTKADAGATGYTSVHLAKSSLAATRGNIPSYEIGLRQSSNQLCTLLGISTQDLARILGTGEIPKAPPEVVVGIPAELLRRRPDIRAAERAVAEQSEQIGIAIADLYPHFSINGTIALDSEKFRHLFAHTSSAGFIGPSFQWNLLNYGRIINNVRLQGFELQELIVGYQNTVLTANQEVEDALVAFLQNQQRVRYLQDTVKESQQALKLLTISFEEGDIDFTGIFVMQGVVATNEDQLAEAVGAVATSLINLYKALGGGWQIRCPGFVPHVAVSQSSEPMEVVPAPEALPPQPTSEIRLLPDIEQKEFSMMPRSVRAMGKPVNENADDL